MRVSEDALDFLIRPPPPQGMKEEGFVNVFYGIAGLVALGLLVYLVIALLKPEWLQ